MENSEISKFMNLASQTPASCEEAGVMQIKQLLICVSPTCITLQSVLIKRFARQFVCVNSIDWIGFVHRVRSSSTTRVASQILQVASKTLQRNPENIFQKIFQRIFNLCHFDIAHWSASCISMSKLQQDLTWKIFEFEYFLIAQEIFWPL